MRRVGSLCVGANEARRKTTVARRARSPPFVRSISCKSDRCQSLFYSEWRQTVLRRLRDSDLWGMVSWASAAAPEQQDVVRKLEEEKPT